MENIDTVRDPVTNEVNYTVITLALDYNKPIVCLGEVGQSFDVFVRHQTNNQIDVYKWSQKKPPLNEFLLAAKMTCLFTTTFFSRKYSEEVVKLLVAQSVVAGEDGSAATLVDICERQLMLVHESLGLSLVGFSTSEGW